MSNNPHKRDNTWTDTLTAGGHRLAAFIRQLVAEGNLRRLVIHTPKGRELLDTSLTTGVAVAGAFALLFPLLTALGALAALLARLRVSVVFSGSPPPP